jgi:hypothetical protein
MRSLAKDRFVPSAGGRKAKKSDGRCVPAHRPSSWDKHLKTGAAPYGSTPSGLCKLVLFGFFFVVAIEDSRGFLVVIVVAVENSRAFIAFFVFAFEGATRIVTFFFVFAIAFGDREIGAAVGHSVAADNERPITKRQERGE